jgi:dihydrofolate reductase
MSISIDGFVGSPDGGPKWVFDSDQEAAAWTLETVWNASLHIMGSRTFHDMAAYWPSSTEVFAPPMSQIPKAVFSRQGSAILKAAGATAALEDARANAGTDRSGQVQPGAEVHPVALGRALPVFSDLTTARSLRLVRSRAFRAGSVAQIYRPA